MLGADEPADAKELTRIAHCREIALLGEPRIVQAESLLHSSVFTPIKTLCDDQPKNLPSTYTVLP